MNKLISSLVALFLTASISFSATTASSPSSVLSQLGASGVTDKIYGTNAALYANYLIKTGTNGLMDVSLLPTSVNPVAWNKMFFVDPVHGTDSSNTVGSVTTPFKTIAYATSRSVDNTVILLEPGTYPNSTITNTAVTNLTIIGQSPETTWINGFIRFDNGVNATLNLYRLKVNEINQNQYKTTTIGLYDRAYLNGAVTRIDTNVTSAITVYRDPSVVLAVGLPSITTTDILTHNATNMAYTAISTNIWWPSLYGPVPITIGQCLENLAGRPIIVQGTANGQIPYWDGTKWALVGTGTVSQVLHGGTNPVFTAVDATNVVYTASTPTNWSLFIGSVPTTVLEALNGVAAYVVPKGTNVGQVAYWSGSRWDLVPAGTSTQVLIGGTAPAFTNFYPMPMGTASGQVACWNGSAWTLIAAGTTNTSLRGGTTPSFVTNGVIPYGTAAGQIAYWNGTNWALVAVGGTNQILYGGSHPAFGNFSLTYNTNNIPFDFVPFTNGVYSIGRPSLQWLNGYFSNAVYIDGNPVLTNATDSGFTNWLATNTYVQIETDPVFTNWVSTNTYVKSEVDPAFTNWRATNTYVKVESDPNFVAWTNGISLKAGNGSRADAYGVAIGLYAWATNGGVAIGNGADGCDSGVGIAGAGGRYGVAIGVGSSAYGWIGGTGNVAIGYNAWARDSDGMYNTTEIGTGKATNNGWFHYRGVAVIDPIGNYYGPTGKFSFITLGGVTTNAWPTGGSSGGGDVFKGSNNVFTSLYTNTFNGDVIGTRSVWGSGLNPTNINSGAYGASQFGQVSAGTMLINGGAGASQHGLAMAGSMIIAGAAVGASQWGSAAGAGNPTATNAGAVGALQLFNLGNNQTSTVTSAGHASIVQGAGTASNKNAIVSGDGQVSHGDGSISAGGGFWDNGIRLTNSVGGGGDVYLAGNNTFTASHTNTFNGDVIGTRSVWGSGLSPANIDPGAYGAGQHGYNAGSIMTIGNGAYGSAQHGMAMGGNMVIDGSAIGASQWGYAAGGGTPMATNAGASGALQLFYFLGNQTSTVTSAGYASIVQGAGTASNKNAHVLGDGQVSHGDGSVSAGGGFWDNGVRVPTNYVGTDVLQTVLDRGNTATNAVAFTGDGRSIWGSGLTLGSIGATAYGAEQHGHIQGAGSMTIGNTSKGTIQRGQAVDGDFTIGTSSYGSSQNGYASGSGNGFTIGGDAHGAAQYGMSGARMTIGNYANGAAQHGSLGSGTSATNNGIGAIQLFDIPSFGGSGPRVAYTTTDGDGSLLLGAGTASNRYAIVAGDLQESHGVGSITALGGFWSGANGLTTNNLGWLSNTNFSPTVSNAFDLGSIDVPWRDLYLGSNSVYMGGDKVISKSGSNLVFNVIPVYQDGTNAPVALGSSERTYPTLVLELGGQYTDFELRCSTNNFANTTGDVYYINSWGPTACPDDTNVWIYFIDDANTNGALSARSWTKASHTNSILAQLVSPGDTEISSVTVYPSHDFGTNSVAWMNETNYTLNWSYIRYDALGPETNSAGRIHYRQVVPIEWKPQRVAIP